MQNDPEPLSSEEKMMIRNKIFEQIGRTFEPPRLMPRVMRVLAVAAVLAGITLVPLRFYKSAPEAQQLVVNRTGDGETKEIVLGDSSVVTLNANSSISYKASIGNDADRQIDLTGNAFFQIRKKADARPFTVHANKLSIAVLGTEFNVNARSKATEVVLTSGKVRLSLNQPGSSTLNMNPGEKVVIDTLNEKMVKSATNTSMYSAWTEGKWNFTSTPLVEVTELIYDYYGIDTRFDSEKLKRLKLNAVIPVTDLATFTEILAKSLDLKITTQNNQLHIHFNQTKH